jgi:hypothetical protein
MQACIRPGLTYGAIHTIAQEDADIHDAGGDCQPLGPSTVRPLSTCLSCRSRATGAQQVLNQALLLGHSLCPLTGSMQGRQAHTPNTLDNCCTPCQVAGTVSHSQEHHSGRKQPAYRRQRCQGGRSAARSCSAGGRSKRASGSAASRRSRAPLSHLCGGPTLACSTRPAPSHSPVTPCEQVCNHEVQVDGPRAHRPALSHECLGLACRPVRLSAAHLPGTGRTGELEGSRE